MDGVSEVYLHNSEALLEGVELLVGVSKEWWVGGGEGR